MKRQQGGGFLSLFLPLCPPALRVAELLLLSLCNLQALLAPLPFTPG